MATLGKLVLLTILAAVLGITLSWIRRRVRRLSPTDSSFRDAIYRIAFTKTGWLTVFATMTLVTFFVALSWPAGPGVLTEAAKDIRSKPALTNTLSTLGRIFWGTNVPEGRSVTKAVTPSPPQPVSLGDRLFRPTWFWWKSFLFYLLLSAIFVCLALPDFVRTAWRAAETKFREYRGSTQKGESKATSSGVLKVLYAVAAAFIGSFLAQLIWAQRRKK